MPTREERARLATNNLPTALTPTRLKIARFRTSTLVSVFAAISARQVPGLSLRRQRTAAPASWLREFAQEQPPSGVGPKPWDPDRRLAGRDAAARCASPDGARVP
jgi:hypothetical protein